MRLAARGSRQLGKKVEKIGDGAELDQVRRQAGGVLLKSAGAGAALTAISLAIAALF